MSQVNSRLCFICCEKVSGVKKKNFGERRNIAQHIRRDRARFWPFVLNNNVSLNLKFCFLILVTLPLSLILHHRLFCTNQHNSRTKCSSNVVHTIVAYGSAQCPPNTIVYRDRAYQSGNPVEDPKRRQSNIGHDRTD